MTGTYTHSIDAKGRLFIPVRLRDELGSEFYVTLSMDDCLSAYSLSSWAKFEEKSNEKPRDEKTRLRPLFSNAAKCELDSQGRILIPQHLRDMVGLKKNVTVVGVGDIAELWDSELWTEVNAKETTKENIAAVFRELGV